MKLPSLTVGLALLLLCGRSAASDQARSEEIEAAEEGVLDRTHYWWNDVTGESQWEKPEYEYTDPETGKPYYLHPETKETSWEKYDELMWQEVQAEDGSGVFYHNAATKASQWEKPIILAWRQVAVGSEEEAVLAPAPADDEEEKDEL
ncbi:hypothetical protein ABPG75_011535 [Micractinium tetrahymenae]